MVSQFPVIALTHYSTVLQRPGGQSMEEERFRTDGGDPNILLPFSALVSEIMEVVFS